MPVNRSQNNAGSGLDASSLDGLMNRIDRDVVSQDAVLRNDPSAAEKAAQLLVVLKEAMRRLETAASSADADKGAQP
ncbi:hypothetical protein LPB72_05315 [Hydrogenophaga crassostreae]|uniref:Uncharacterized protein n=2 Tax=Hydrogenophaga crassostreae TaxID=1763535 RepID=A0A167INV5_9BURK|nr:hypothetical protein LPB072_19235 [Hydrogenophaga crassostreae]OAD43263.1 hypothetical protein LPB72_05315 [Hydrogenophaga crassostreae]